jgi:hypothetical protein
MTRGLDSKHLMHVLLSMCALKHMVAMMFWCIIMFHKVLGMFQWSVHDAMFEVLGCIWVIWHLMQKATHIFTIHVLNSIWNYSWNFYHFFVFLFHVSYYEINVSNILMWVPMRLCKWYWVPNYNHLLHNLRFISLYYWWMYVLHCDPFFKFQCFELHVSTPLYMNISSSLACHVSNLWGDNELLRMMFVTFIYDVSRNFIHLNSNNV